MLLNMLNINKKSMIKDLINAIKSEAEHIKNVKSFKYQAYDLINAQNNNATIQIIVENNIFVQYLVTKDLTKVSINIDILGKVTQDKDELDVHNDTLKVGIVLMKLLESKYSHLASIYDYNFIAVDRFTDDVLSGQRMSLELVMGSPVDACNITDYLDELNEYDKYENKPIDIQKPQIDINNIDINPIKFK